VLGFDDQPLFTVPYADLEAVVSELGHRSVEANAETVLHHEMVVEGIRQMGPAIPVRFGTVLSDPQNIVQALRSRLPDLSEDLKRLGDKLELGLSVLWDQADGNPEELGDQPWQDADGPGARYLRARFSQYRRDVERRDRATQIARELESKLGSLALEHRSRILPTQRLAVRVAYLVHPLEMEDFQHAFAELRQERSDLRFLLSGPWPPYTFVTKSEAHGRAVIDQLVQDAGWMADPVTAASDRRKA
jgi:hypothetical protein